MRVDRSQQRVSDWKWTRTARRLLKSQLRLEISFLKRMCALNFLCHSWTMHNDYCFSPLVFFHSFSFSVQRSTLVPTPGSSTPLNRSFRPFLLALFFLLFFSTYHSQSSGGCLCVASSCWWKKTWLPNGMCFSGCHSIRYVKRMFEEGKSTNRIVHVGFL